MARLLHNLYHAVEAHAVLAVGERRVEVGVERAGCGKGVALDTGYLNQSAYRVAGHTQVVFQSHLCRILYLCRAATEKLAGCGTGHSAGYAHLALATHVGAGDGGVLLDHVADDSSRGKSVQDAGVAELVAFGKMV